MGVLSVAESIEKLGADFPNLNWNFEEHRIGKRKELISQWLGDSDEDIMVCVFKGKEIHEKFHRQDFFFINYAYTGDYGAQSYRFDNHANGDGTFRTDSDRVINLREEMRMWVPGGSERF